MTTRPRLLELLAACEESRLRLLEAVDLDLSPDRLAVLVAERIAALDALGVALRILPRNTHPNAA